jgi:hypothetical protein
MDAGVTPSTRRCRRGVVRQEMNGERHPQALAIEKAVRRARAVLGREGPGDVLDLNVAHVALGHHPCAVRVEAHLLCRETHEEGGKA